MDFKIKNFQCLYVRVFSDAHASRFVWKKEKGPDLVPADGYRREKEKKKKGPPTAAEKAALAREKARKKREIIAGASEEHQYLRGRGMSWKPGDDPLSRVTEEPLTPNVITPPPVEVERTPQAEAIDPTPDVLNGLRAKMDLIKQAEFPERAARKYEGVFTDRFKNIIADLREAMLMQAIVENVSADVLMATYASTLHDLRSQAESSADPNFVAEFIRNKTREYLPSVSKAFEWKVPKSAGKSFENDNPHLADHVIKPEHKPALANALTILDAYYAKRFVDEHAHTFGSDDFREEDYDKKHKRKGFLEETEIPFYADLLINKAIVLNEHADNPAMAAEQLAVNYSERLKTLYRTLLYDADPGKLAKLVQEQEKEDNEETGKRLNDSGWQAATVAIEKIITASEEEE